MQTGDIVFFKHSTPISKFISYVTKSPYTHVAIAINSTVILEADRFIKVRIRKIEDEEIYTIKRIKGGLSPSEKYKLHNYALSYLGVEYDYLSVLGWFFRLVFNVNGNGFIDNANRVYCSELVDRLYKELGYDIAPNSDTGDVLPSQLFDSPMLETIK